MEGEVAVSSIKVDAGVGAGGVFVGLDVGGDFLEEEIGFFGGEAVFDFFAAEDFLDGGFLGGAGFFDY